MKIVLLLVISHKAPLNILKRVQSTVARATIQGVSAIAPAIIITVRIETRIGMIIVHPTT